MPVHSHLRLAPHVRACHTNGQVILLDLRRSKYVGVGGRGLLTLAQEVQGWPQPPTGQATPTEAAQTGDIDALTRPLIKQGLLTEEEMAPAPAGLHQMAAATLDGEGAIAAACTGPLRVMRFLLSAARASASLKFSPLLGIATRLTSRRARLERSGAPADLGAVRDAVGAYQKLRPLLFTAHDRCLHDSLSLLHFLASEGIAATWVLGVKTGPFAAHAWVQRANVVLNDQHEHVRAFEPILVA